MVYVTTSDAVIMLAFWTGAGAIVLTIVLFMQILLLRVRLVMRKRRDQVLIDRWRPLLVQALDTPVAQLPRLPYRDVSTFLSLWNHLHESLRGESKASLNRVASAVGLGSILARMLKNGGARERLIAVVSLGNLRDRSSWEVLVLWAGSDKPALSLAAARALVLIDTSESLPILFPLILNRTDWSSARVASILREAGATSVAPYLNKAVRTAGPEQLPRLLRYMQAVCPMESLTSIRMVLEKAEDDHVISTALQVYSDPSNLNAVRNLLQHPRWHIRVQAASALGRLGAPGDDVRLKRLLSDEQWWVRYRAAQALASLPFLELEDLRRIKAEQTDRFARDILDQVMAEANLR